MNAEIEQWRVQAYSSVVTHLSQQKESRLAPFVRKEFFTGKTSYFDRLASGTAVVRQGRNQDTVDLDLTHSRRAVTTAMYEWATLVDRKDKLQNIHSPESEYSKAAAQSLGRAMDNVIIAGLLGSATTGETGSSSVTLGNAQKVAAVSGGALSRPNIQLIRKAKYLMDAAEAPSEGRVLAHNAGFLEAMLAQTETTSADFNTIRALVAGEIDTFLGFKWVRLELLGLASAYDADAFKWNSTTGLYDASGTLISAASTAVNAIAFCGSGLILGMNEGAFTSVDRRPDKGHNLQVYASRDMGAVRMEEVQVVQMYSLP